MDQLSIQASYQTFNAGENIIASRDIHNIGIHTGSPLRLFQNRDGKQIERLFIPGDFVLIPAGMDNYCAHDAPAEGLYIDIPPQLLINTALQIDLDPNKVKLQTTFGAPDPILYQNGKLIHQEFQSSEIGGQLYVESLAQQIAIHLLRRYSTQSITPSEINFSIYEARQRIQPSLDLIHACLDQDLSLDTLAAESHLTSYHFSRVFKKATGQTPHQYLITQRIERVKQLLKNTQLTIAEIANTSGFSDQSHLTRQMKHLTGMSPRQYQKHILL